nr:hypothetical protein B0A51_15049 [Rachicladosporium sp. CCFEE 5018]
MAPSTQTTETEAHRIEQVIATARQELKWAEDEREENKAELRKLTEERIRLNETLHGSGPEGTFEVEHVADQIKRLASRLEMTWECHIAIEAVYAGQRNSLKEVEAERQRIHDRHNTASSLDTERQSSQGRTEREELHARIDALDDAGVERLLQRFGAAKE